MGTPLIVPAIFGITVGVLVLPAALCFCVCRAAGTCGTRVYQKEVETQKISCMFINVVVVVVCMAFVW